MSTDTRHGEAVLPLHGEQQLVVEVPCAEPPAVLWLTGRSGAGKTTIAHELELQLRQRGRMSAIVDGDELRAGLCRDLGFSAEDRAENMRRAAEVTRVLTGAGLIVIVALISPFRAARAQVRALFELDQFFEVHIDAPLEVTERRDPKGLYRRARNNEVKQFTGLDSPYEPPQSPELRLDTVSQSPAQCAATLVELLVAAGKL